MMMRFHLWLRREPEPLSADSRLAELLAMVGGWQGPQRGLTRMKRKNSPRISGFG